MPMDAVHAIVLALIQGLTEFLPISSSGHLILAPAFFGWADQGLGFDVAVHLGSLLAVLTYFWSEILAMFRSWLRSFTGTMDGEARLAWAVIVGTVPAVVAGFFARDWVATVARDPMLIAATTAGFGVLLWLADRYGRGRRDEHGVTWTDAVVVGLAQALALVPGTSRSGITMTAGLAMGLSRQGAARFSFLLAIPVIAGASLLQATELAASEAAVDWTMLGLGTAVAAGAAFTCIHYFLALIGRIGMAPFAIYRLLLAGAILLLYA